MRMKHTERRGHIISAALAVARNEGYFELTRDKVAKRAECSPGLVQYHFNSTEELRVAVIEAANKLKDLKVLSQIVGTLDPLADLIASDLVEPSLEYIRGR